MTSIFFDYEEEEYNEITEELQRKIFRKKCVSENKQRKNALQSLKLHLATEPAILGK